MVAVAGKIADRHLGVGNVDLDQPLDLGGVHRHRSLPQSGRPAGHIGQNYLSPINNLSDKMMVLTSPKSKESQKSSSLTPNSTPRNSKCPDPPQREPRFELPQRPR